MEQVVTIVATWLEFYTQLLYSANQPVGNDALCAASRTNDDIDIHLFITISK